jgi:hypothetical protein
LRMKATDAILISGSRRDNLLPNSWLLPFPDSSLGVSGHILD